MYIIIMNAIHLLSSSNIVIIAERGGKVESSKAAERVSDSVSSKISSLMTFILYVIEGRLCDKGRKLVRAVKSRLAVRKTNSLIYRP